MSDKELWTTFEKSGNIVDYLSYKGIQLHNKAPEESKTGDRTFESKNNSDRDDIVRHTYR